MPKTYKITVKGRPRPKGRPRFGRGGHVYTPKETLEYEKKIREAAHGIVDEKLEGQNLTFIVKVYFKNRVHGDCDNYVKIAQDALNKFAFKDDKQIKHIEGHLLYCDGEENQRMEITIIDRDA